MAIERLLETKPILMQIIANAQIKLSLGILYAVLFDISKEPALIAIFFLIIIDFLTGVAAAKKTGIQVRSAKIFRTATKLLTYFGMISAGYLLEKSIGYNLGADDIMIIFLAATEFISIMENVGKLGYKTPNKLLNVVENLRDEPKNKNKS